MLLREHFVDGELVADLADEADADGDTVSITYLIRGLGLEPSADDEMDGAVIFIKGEVAALAFAEWAESRGMLTRGKPIRGVRPGAN